VRSIANDRLRYRPPRDARSPVTRLTVRVRVLRNGRHVALRSSGAADRIRPGLKRTRSQHSQPSRVRAVPGRPAAAGRPYRRSRKRRELTGGAVGDRAGHAGGARRGRRRGCRRLGCRRGGESRARGRWLPPVWRGICRCRAAWWCSATWCSRGGSMGCAREARPLSVWTAAGSGCHAPPWLRSRCSNACRRPAWSGSR